MKLIYGCSQNHILLQVLVHQQIKSIDMNSNGIIVTGRRDQIESTSEWSTHQFDFHTATSPHQNRWKEKKAHNNSIKTQSQQKSLYVKLELSWYIRLSDNLQTSK